MENGPSKNNEPTPPQGMQEEGIEQRKLTTLEAISEFLTAVALTAPDLLAELVQQLSPQLIVYINRVGPRHAAASVIKQMRNKGPGGWGGQ